MIALVLSLAAAMPVSPAASSPLEEPCTPSRADRSSIATAKPALGVARAAIASSASSASAPKKQRKLGRIKPADDEYPCGELAPIRTTVEAIFPPVAQIEPEPQFTPVPPEPTAFGTLALPPSSATSDAVSETVPCECFGGGGPIAFYPVPVGGGVFVPPQVTPITTPVPEPGVFALLLAGLAVMAWRRV